MSERREGCMSDESVREREDEEMVELGENAEQRVRKWWGLTGRKNITLIC